MMDLGAVKKTFYIAEIINEIFPPPPDVGH
jgi:hypothetical protein